MTINFPAARASDGQAVLSPGADPRANRETESSSTVARRRSALSPEGRRLRKLTDGELADEVATFEARIDALKAEAIRREIRRAEGGDFRITLTPPATSQHRQAAVASGHGDHRGGIHRALLPPGADRLAVDLHGAPQVREGGVIKAPVL